MNKKRLSVVMAGAMLATSVAPVLAEEVKATEISANELGLLQEEVRRLIESAPKFANEAANKVTLRTPSGNKVVDVRNQSIYEVVINGVPQTQLTATASTQDWQDAFNGLRVGDTVKVYDRGSKEVNGKYYHFETITGEKVYDKAELATLKTNLKALESTTGVIKKVDFKKYSNDEIVLVELNDDPTVPGEESEKIMEIKLGDKEIDFNGTEPKYYKDKEQTIKGRLTSTNKDTVKPEQFFGFVLKEGVETDTKEIAGKIVKDYVITPGGYNYNVSDLYDGLFLTDKGNEFFGMLKDGVAAERNVKIVINDPANTNKDDFFAVGSKDGDATLKGYESQIKGKLKDFNGLYRFEVRFAAKGQLKAETYTISGKDKAEVARLASWMIKPQARVDKFEGSNRYETAALLAREYAGLTRTSVNDKIKPIKEGTNVNIVLVNGDKLVDGLAAAPLAASKANKVRRAGETVEVSAPVLLTEAGHLPKETKAYLREVLSNVAVGDLPKVTINLVGGETVLTKDLERELKAIGYHGFKVERFGGDTREATSLEVAKEIKSDDVFVVGGNGEADAMSIAAVAAEQKTPIIVSNVNGLTEDGVYEVRDKDVMIVGGEKVVTPADEAAIRTEAKSVNRLKGANRKATNAKVIERYYNRAGFADSVGSAQNVIVAKDGIRNKGELVDALAAANMASEKNAPIVLATDSLSKEQETVINSYANDAYGLFQVGGQVNKEVVRTIARMLNLTNR